MRIRHDTQDSVDLNECNAKFAFGTKTEGAEVDILQSIASRFSDKSLPQLTKSADLPKVDDDQAIAANDIGYAEGQSFIIDYVDSGGHTSHRRITVWAIAENNNGIPLLNATCHERKAYRQFRIDRISCCYDFDGVVYDDVPKFLSEAFGISFTKASAKDDNILNSALGLIKYDAVILASMAIADNIRRKCEADIAAEFLSIEAEKRGVFLEEYHVDKISKYFLRMRPTEKSLIIAIDAIRNRNTEQVRRLLIAASNLMDADGDRHESEVGLLNRLAVELIGVSIV